MSLSISAPRAIHFGAPLANSPIRSVPLYLPRAAGGPSLGGRLSLPPRSWAIRRAAWAGNWIGAAAGLYWDTEWHGEVRRLEVMGLEFRIVWVVERKVVFVRGIVVMKRRTGV